MQGTMACSVCHVVSQGVRQIVGHQLITDLQDLKRRTCSYALGYGFIF